MPVLTPFFCKGGCVCLQFWIGEVKLPGTVTKVLQCLVTTLHCQSPPSLWNSVMGDPSGGTRIIFTNIVTSHLYLTLSLVRTPQLIQRQDQWGIRYPLQLLNLIRGSILHLVNTILHHRHSLNCNDVTPLVSDNHQVNWHCLIHDFPCYVCV